MKVRATKVCFVGDRLRTPGEPGSEFEIDAALFSKQCMERVEDEKPESPEPETRAGRKSQAK